MVTQVLPLGLFLEIFYLECVKYAVSCEQEGLIVSQGHLLCWDIDILVNTLVFQ